MNKQPNEQTAGHGITKDDLKRIKEYLQKDFHVRTVDDLRPSTER